jgi:hypothetical protein
MQLFAQRIGTEFLAHREKIEVTRHDQGARPFLFALVKLRFSDAHFGIETLVKFDALKYGSAVRSCSDLLDIIVRPHPEFDSAPLRFRNLGVRTDFITFRRRSEVLDFHCGTY